MLNIPFDASQNRFHDGLLVKLWARSWRVREAIFTAVFYCCSYWLLDWISFIYPFEQLNITPWNPPPAASVVLLLLRGFRWLPVLLAGSGCLAAILAGIASPWVFLPLGAGLALYPLDRLDERLKADLEHPEEAIGLEELMARVEALK